MKNNFLNLSDEELLLELQKGHNQALDVLYQRHSGKVLGYCQKRGLRREQAEEVLQIVFLQLFRKKEQYLSQHQALAWIYVITKSELKDYRHKERKSVVDLDYLPSQTAEMPPITEQKPDIAESLQSLPAESEKILRMRYLDEMEYREISEKLQQSETSLRQIVSRSLKLLRKNRENS